MTKKVENKGLKGVYFQEYEYKLHSDLSIK